ncbi:MAG: MFS transporter [Thermodesulfobacteriota bacterium]
MESDPKGLKLVFRSLIHRNYRLFFGGQGISLIGTWMQQMAMNWLVYRLTGSAFLLGVVGFSSRIPTFVFSPLAGVFVDRWNRHRILIVTQILSMIQALTLAVLVLTSKVVVWHIISLSIALGLINALDTPARQAFVVDMIEKREDLGNAIALNSSMNNGARLVGPSFAGLLIAAVGEGVCFLLNGLSFLAVVASLLAMKVRVTRRETQHPHVLEKLREGFSYAFGFPPIRALLLLVGLVSFMGMPFTTLMPIFAKDILHGDPRTLGFLLASVGVGALTGAYYLASRKSVLGLGKIIVIASIVFGSGLIGFSFSRALPISLALMMVVGFGMMVQFSSSNIVLQTLSEEDKLGRVMSFYTMAGMGMMPFGSLLSGMLAHAIGAPQTVLIGGICSLGGSLLFARKLPLLRRVSRPIYLNKGIISGDKSEAQGVRKNHLVQG